MLAIHRFEKMGKKDNDLEEARRRRKEAEERTRLAREKADAIEKEREARSTVLQSSILF